MDPTKEEQLREYRKNWLKKKYDTDPEWRAKQIDRVKASLNDRYKNDPVYREQKKAYAKERARKNAEMIKEYQKRYKEEHREALNDQDAARKKERYNTDPEFKEKCKTETRARYATPEYRVYANDYKAKRKLTDPMFKVASNLRRRINNALKGRDKSAATLELLGCTVEQFKAHLESLWLPGMSWENYNYRGWHIDHRDPVALADLSDPDQQKKCFHYTNLQPLWREVNQSKGASPQKIPSTTQSPPTSRTG